jgi:hypothetical protein
VTRKPSWAKRAPSDVFSSTVLRRILPLGKNRLDSVFVTDRRWKSDPRRRSVNVKRLRRPEKSHVKATWTVRYIAESEAFCFWGKKEELRRFSRMNYHVEGAVFVAARDGNVRRLKVCEFEPDLKRLLKRHHHEQVDKCRSTLGAERPSGVASYYKIRNANFFFWTIVVSLPKGTRAVRSVTVRKFGVLLFVTIPKLLMWSLCPLFRKRRLFWTNTILRQQKQAKSLNLT